MDKQATTKKEIQQNLLHWFDKNKRDLPWRKTKDPYKIWVSEIMLQQTRVDTVIAYYNRFIESFPTVEDLAAADEQDVLKHWQGLGYYSRARNLHKGAQMVREQFGGEFPKEPDKVKKIPGIGPYTAGAILSIAFNLPYPAVDGNVLRVFSRVFAIKEDIAQPQTVKLIQQKAAAYMPERHEGNFTEALMELGALICIPVSPLCLTCPLFHQCEARLQGIHVLKHWQGLGYYSRARNLHKGAQMVREQFGGEFPKEPDKVKKIPGIGPYTAGAILSIAFNLPYPAVDGNVLRVFSRVFAIKEDIAQPQTVKLIQQKAAAYMPERHEGNFTEALMELGALICIPVSPLCLTCPLFHQCEARLQGIQDELPVKRKKAKPRPMHMVFCIIGCGTEILIVQNPFGRLLKGMWGFPGQEGSTGKDEETVERILTELGIAAAGVQKWGTARHIFTHMDWDMHIYRCEAESKQAVGQPHRWIGKEETDQYPFPKVYQKILSRIKW